MTTLLTGTGLLGHKAALADLATKLDALVGWTLLASTTPGTAASDDSWEYYFEGPGTGVTRKVFINFKTFSDSGPASIFTIETKGALAYSGGLDFYSQAGTNPDPVYCLLWDGLVDYRAYVTDRQVKIIFKASNLFPTIHAGFMLPYATPDEWPFPLYIASCYDEQQILTFNNASRRNFADPGDRSGWLRDPTGTWMMVANHESGAGADNYQQDSGGGELGVTRCFIYPYHTGAGSSARTNYPNLPSLDLRNMDNLNPARLAIPLEIFGSSIGGGVKGLIEEAYWVPGTGVSSEDTFVFDSDTYRIFQNVDRNDKNHFFAVKEIDV